jgi:cytochrome c oxidase assembly protein subunit 15
MYNKKLHWFASFTAACTGILIFIGGLVTSTNSGLSVPDWPTTFGENMFTYPLHKWVGGVQYEHGHRLFASFVGLLMVLLTITVWKVEKRKWVKILTYFALFAVILQGVLGGVTVLLKLPPAVSIAHGMLAQSFFCLVTCVALFTSRWWFESKEIVAQPESSTVLKYFLAAVIVVFTQLFFGALLRHTYSGLAIPDFPLSYHQLVPSISDDQLSAYNQHLIALGIKHPADRPVMAYQIVVHFIHRSWAYVAAVVVFLAGYKMSTSSFSHFLRRLGKMLIGIVATQFLLGVLTVLTQKNVVITTAHVFLGAVTLMLTVVLAVMAGKVRNDSAMEEIP